MNLQNKNLEINENSRTAAETGHPTGQPTSKNHNYFYTNSNQVIQEPKSHPKKSSFWKKYYKNEILYVSIPEFNEPEHVQLNPTSLFCFLSCSNNHASNFFFIPYQININEHEFILNSWYLRFHMLIHSNSQPNHEKK